MTSFVSQVRELLDRTARSGQHRWLCVRVPCHLAAHDRLGIDLQKFVQHGVEMVNLSPHYFTEQQTDLAKIRKLVPNVTLYLKLTHCTSIGRKLSSSGGDNFTFCRTTDEQFYTAAHLAYARGADGVSTFNFVYYREHGSPGRGPFNEPPFHVLRHLGDPGWLANQPQDYILGNVNDVPHIPDRQIPKIFKAGETETFKLNMAPPNGGWKREGKLLIQGAEPLEESSWTVVLNGKALKSTKDVSEPYPSPYVSCSPSRKHLLAWDVPTELLVDGENRIGISLKSGAMPFLETFLYSSNTLTFIGLAVK